MKYEIPDRMWRDNNSPIFKAWLGHKFDRTSNQSFNLWLWENYRLNRFANETEDYLTGDKKDITMFLLRWS